MKAKITHYLITLLILTIIITFCFFSCSPSSPGEQTIEEPAQETIEENSIKESEEEPAEEVVANEPVEETEPNIALEIVELAKSQIGKLTGDGPFASLIWADSEITYCDRFVSVVMAVASGKPLSERKSYPTAYDDYIAHEGLIKSGEPPKGAVVYYGKHKENWNCGHVGISDGEGNIISVVNRTKGVDIIPRNYFRAPLLGWVTFKEYKSQEEVVEEEKELPTIKLEIYEGPTPVDDICYYRVEAIVTGNPTPTITYSKDDSNGNLGYGKAQVNLKEGETYTLTAKASNSVGEANASIKIVWPNANGNLQSNSVNFEYSYSSSDRDWQQQKVINNTYEIKISVYSGVIFIYIIKPPGGFYDGFNADFVLIIPIEDLNWWKNDRPISLVDYIENGKSYIVSKNGHKFIVKVLSVTFAEHYGLNILDHILLSVTLQY